MANLLSLSKLSFGNGFRSIIARRQSCPLLKGSMEGTGLREANFQGDVINAEFIIAEVVYGHVSADLILDGLKRRMLILQSTSQCLRTGVELTGYGLEIGHVGF